MHQLCRPIKYLDSPLKLNHCKTLASNISKLILFLNFKKIDLNDLYNVTITEWLFHFYLITLLNIVQICFYRISFMRFYKHNL